MVLEFTPRERLADVLKLRFPEGIDCLLFDADGTLFDIEYDSWTWLTRKLAEKFDLGMTPDEAVSKHEKLYNEYENTKDSVPNAYKIFIDALTSLWTNNGTVFIKERHIEEICELIPLREGVLELVTQAKEAGKHIGIITASYSIVARVMARKLGLDLEDGDFAEANTDLGFNLNGYFTGIADQITEFEDFKVIQLVKTIQKFGLVLVNILAFGDSSTDLSVFRRLGTGHLNQGQISDVLKAVAGGGIAVRSSNEALVGMAFAHIDGFKEFVGIFKQYLLFRSRTNA